MKNPDSSLTVTTSFLREIFGLTDQRIGQLAKAGVMVRSARGRFLAWESVKNYVAFLRERRATRSENGEPDDYEKHRARLYAARADAQEIVTARLKGGVHDGEAVAAVVNEMLANARSRLLAIPTIAAPKVSDLSDPNACKDVLTEAIHEALAELAAYPAETVVARQLKLAAPEAEADDMGAEPEAE